MRGVAMLLLLLAGPAHAETIVIGREHGGTLVVEREAHALVAVWTRDGAAAVRTELLAEPAPCTEVHGAPGGLEVQVCQPQGDLVQITPWRLEAARGVLRAGAPYEHSAYADAATMIVRDLRAHRFRAARTALAALPALDDPIDWWWEAQWLAAEWPAKGVALRRRISRLLTQPGGVYALLAHGDLALLPVVGLPVTAAALPDADALLDRAERVLRAGSLDDIAVADELAAALDAARHSDCH